MKKKLRNKALISLAISSLIVLLFYLVSPTKFFQSLEMKTFDQRMDMRTHDVKSHQDIVVILVDEASLNAMEGLVGRWPWPRSIFGDLINSLSEWGAKTIMFDVLYTEPSTPRDSEGSLGDDDLYLVEATAGSGIAIHSLHLFEDSEDEHNKNLLNRPMPQDFIEQFAMKNVTSKGGEVSKHNKYYLPIRELYQNSSDIGVVEFSSDSDGVYRSSELIREYQGNFFPTLPMAYLQKEFSVKKTTMETGGVRLDKINIPLGHEGRYLINIKDNFTNFSIAGVLATIQKLNNGETDNLIVSPDDFKDKVIFIGASAAGVEDLKLTPLGTRVPGVYLHASIVSNVLNNNFIKKVDVRWIYLITFIICFIISLMVMVDGRIIHSVASFLTITSCYIIAGHYLLDYYQYWLVLVSPISALSFTFLAAFIYMSFTEGKEKRFLKAAFSNYISPELIDEMHHSGEPPKLGGDCGMRTAYFTDIQSFSTFSEQLTATQLVELLNEYLTAMTDILLEDQGTLDKYEGDAIIAFFGAPMPLEDHAIRGCRVAVKMQDALLVLRKKWVSEGEKWPQIVHEMRMRIGVNSGEIVTGNMGSKTRMNYTMMGDSVNLAARLEEAAKQYGIFTQISHFTRDLIGDHFELRELDTVRVVGKSEPVTTFEIFGEKDKTEQLLIDLANTFHRGLALYKEQQWDGAQKEFESSLEMEFKRFPKLKEKTNPSKIYIKRCQDYKQSPPGADWDGVYSLTSK
jgi:adenylate cyclase